MTLPTWEHVVGWWNCSISFSKNKESKNQFVSWLSFPFLQSSYCLARGMKQRGIREGLLPWWYQRFISTGIFKPSVKSYDPPFCAGTLETHRIGRMLCLHISLYGENPHQIHCKGAAVDSIIWVFTLFSHLTLLNKNVANLSFQNLEVTKNFILCFISSQFLPLSETQMYPFSYSNWKLD